MRIQRPRSFGNAASRFMRGNGHRAGIEYVVAFGAGADPRHGEPAIDLAKARALEQLAAKDVTRLRFLRRQRHAAIQQQENQFWMHLADVTPSVVANERIDLHDLVAEMPELA